MSVKSEITRIKDAKEAIRMSVVKKGQTLDTDAKIDAYSAVIDALCSLGGAAGGKFTWDGSYPISCDCSGMESAPTSIVLFCPDLIYALASTKEAAIVVGKTIGTSNTTYFVIVKRDNTINTALLHDWIVYDADTSSILIKDASSAWTLLSGKDYYWVAV